MATAKTVQVELEVSTWIEGRGVRHVNWKVRVNDAWVPITELRNVVSTMTDPELSFGDEVDELRVLPPQCQYRRTYHLKLPVGSRVERRVSVPLEQPAIQGHAPETLEAAFRSFIDAGYRRQSALKTIFTDFRVTARGVLVTEAEWQRWHRARHDRSAQQQQAPMRTSAVACEEIEAFVQRLGKAG